MQAIARPAGLVLRLLIGLVAALLLLLATATAQDDRAEELDRLFADLRTAPDPATAQRIDRQIWLIWMSPTDPVLAERMNAALEARGSGDYGEAIRLLDQLVADHPDYAEGWNQRATIHFMTGNLEASLADCARVLELEPRHFGALSGRALIYLQLDNRALALKDMVTALAIHPFLNERFLFPELQREMTQI